eukprot:3061305-Pyramimonas_sp.AAC.1
MPHSRLTIHYSLLPVCYSLLTTRSPLPTKHYSLLTTHYSLRTTRFSLLARHYLLLSTHYSLFTIHYLLLSTHYSLLSAHSSLSRGQTLPPPRRSDERWIRQVQCVVGDVLLGLLTDCDHLLVEAVVERLDVRQQLERPRGSRGL